METYKALVEGERVALGPLRRDLLPLYGAWEMNLELTALRGLEPRPKGDATREEWFQSLVTDPSCAFFTIYETVFEHREPRPIGMSMLLRIDRVHRSCELGIFLGETDVWGGGFGTEATRLTVDYAFHALGLHSVLVRVVAKNRRAQRAYERAGFRVVGRQRESFRLGGRVFDEILMDCVVTDFESPVLERFFEKVFDGCDRTVERL